MKSLVAAGCAMTLLLSGCMGGVSPGDNSPRETHTVPRDYKAVYLRLENQAHECISPDRGVHVKSQLDPDTQSGSVMVVLPVSGAVLARSDFKAMDAQHTQVTYSVVGRYPWDLNALHAMRESVLLDSSICFAYK